MENREDGTLRLIIVLGKSVSSRMIAWTPAHFKKGFLLHVCQAAAS